MSNGRGRGPINSRPWGWYEKSVIRAIQDAYDSKTYLDQALAIYLILTLKASDEQSSTFHVKKREIAAKAGVSLRRVTTILSEFRGLGFLDWEQNQQPGSKELLPNTYTLMSGTGCPRLGTERIRDNCAVLEESKKNPKKNVVEEGAAPTTTNLEQLIAELKQQYPQHNVSYELERCRRHYESKQIKVTATLARRWMSRAELPLKRPKAKSALGSAPAPLPEDDPVKRAEFLKRLGEWKAKGRPLGAFPELNPQVDLLGETIPVEKKEKRLGYLPTKELVAEVRKVFPNAQLLSKVSAPNDY